MDSNNNAESEGRWRKRKRSSVAETEEEDDERKMEKFLDLIQNLREGRERLMKKNQKGGVAVAENKEEKKSKGGWEPRFEVQDFAQHQEAIAATLVPFNNTAEAHHHSHRQPTTPTGLDLTLSL